MSQLNQIRARLDKGHAITPMDALAMFGCFRLSARIYDLRSEGYPVEVTIINVGDKKVAKYTKGKKWAR